MILMYDLEDNYIMEFKNTKECAKYIGCSVKSIRSKICRFKKGKQNKIRDFKHQRWVKMYRDWDEYE